jgi:squalene-associated FAD-dependent desaturase
MDADLTPPLATHVAVIGGGCAGLAAATRLAQQGLQVTLYESSPQLGGRARGLSWKGQRLDNGQHILLGAYRDTLGLMHLASVDMAQALLRLPLQLEMHRRFKLKACAYLPAPLHILAGLMFAHGLSWQERWSAICFMARLRGIGFRLDHDLPLATWLTQCSQPETVTRWLWEPLCLAALNTPLHTASAQVFLNVLRDSFAKAKSDSDMLLPKQDLSRMLAEPLSDYIRSKDGQVRLGVAVTGIRKIGQGYEVISPNDTRYFSQVVIATSPFRAGALLAELPEMEESHRLIDVLMYQPIYTVYLQYPGETRLDKPMLGFAEGYSQWVFDRGQLYGQHGLMAVVISAEGRHQVMTQERLAVAVIEEMGHHFPALPAPIWHKVIAEKRATFACTDGLQRPAAITPLAGLYLAGDYVAGDYPATIEGAVRCGLYCADHIIQHTPAGAIP